MLWFLGFVQDSILTIIEPKARMFVQSNILQSSLIFVVTLNWVGQFSPRYIYFTLFLLIIKTESGNQWVTSIIWLWFLGFFQDPILTIIEQKATMFVQSNLLQLSPKCMVILIGRAYLGFVKIYFPLFLLLIKTEPGNQWVNSIIVLWFLGFFKNQSKT